MEYFIRPILTFEEARRLRTLLETGSRANFELDKRISFKLAAALEDAQRPRRGRLDLFRPTTQGA